MFNIAHNGDKQSIFYLKLLILNRILYINSEYRTACEASCTATPGQHLVNGKLTDLLRL